MEVDAIVGPKGQVLIPKKMRETHGILPGSRVRLRDAGKSLEISPEKSNPEKAFEEIARQVKFKGKIDSDRSYDEMMEERRKKVFR